MALVRTGEGSGLLAGPEGRRMMTWWSLVEQDHVDVGRDATRQVGLVHWQAAAGREVQVVEGERLVLAQRGVGPPVEEGAHRGVGDEIRDDQADDEHQGQDGHQAPLEGHPSRGRRRV